MADYFTATANRYMHVSLPLLLLLLLLFSRVNVLYYIYLLIANFCVFLSLVIRFSFSFGTTHNFYIYMYDCMHTFYNMKRSINEIKQNKTTTEQMNRLKYILLKNGNECSIDVFDNDLSKSTRVNIHIYISYGWFSQMVAK